MDNWAWLLMFVPAAIITLGQAHWVVNNQHRFCKGCMGTGVAGAFTDCPDCRGSGIDKEK